VFSDTHSNTAYWSSGGAGSTAWGRYRPWYSAESRTEFAEDSSQEGRVSSEPVSEMGFSGRGN
jgi:hypothetical protein